METHIGDGIRSFPCNNCSETFRTKIELIHHLRNHGIVEKTFLCDRCFKEFSTIKSLKVHIKRAHNMTVEPCEICRAVFTTRELVAQHIKEAHEPLICEICDKRCSTPSKLKLHKKIHFQRKPYKCKICTESFINNVVLDRHMRFHGVSAKVFRCEFCSKELSTEASHRNHVQRLHSLTVPCELCKKEFLSREALNEHLRIEHEPSICSVCDKTFALPRYLTMHEKLHKDETPRIQCQECSKYLGVKNIKSHVYRKHLNQFEAWCLLNPTL